MLYNNKKICCIINKNNGYAGLNNWGYAIQNYFFKVTCYLINNTTKRRSEYGSNF